ncbi:MAG: hypothetical protein NZM12_02855, partial [Steroidobacteraceae bacterium]|nr:hypothetical protein [Steroidobacteraceae bacterium]
RLRRLRAQLATPLAPIYTLTRGELAAMSWLTESLAQAGCLQAFPQRVLALDFDEFLVDVPAGLRRVRDHLQLADLELPAGGRIDEVLSRYSKAPAAPYSPAERARLLAEARRVEAEEIRRGLRWLESLARQEALVARLFDRVKV